MGGIDSSSYIHTFLINYLLTLPPRFLHHLSLSLSLSLIRLLSSLSSIALLSTVSYSSSSAASSVKSLDSLVSCMEQVIMESSEAHEEAIGNNMNDYGYIVKGKRTKRQRLVLPTSATTMTSSSSGGSGGGGGGDDRSLPSPTTSTGFSGSTQEEEDMANCLILLARGGLQPRLEESGAERFSSRRFAEAAAATTTTAGKPGFDVYECKTCNRCFPSFQALGGHRASHKKPKAAVEEKKPLEEENETAGSPQKSTIPYNKSRVHECSICGSEFSSGQALGGHMRRHRTAAIVEAQENRRKERNILPLDLDLNLPAPEEDRDFMTGKPPLLFPASALVDCHY